MNFLCDLLVAVFTGLTALLTFYKVTSMFPLVQAEITDLPFSYQKGSNAEKLQKEGFCCLNVHLFGSQETSLIKGIKVSQSLIGEMPINDELPGSLHKEKYHFESLCGPNQEKTYQFLIKPEYSESGTLKITIYLRWFFRISTKVTYSSRFLCTF